jgi:hypothetical protein
MRSRRLHAHARLTTLSYDGEACCMAGIVTHLRRLLDGCLEALSSRFARWTKPLASSLPLQTLVDLSRSKSKLVAEIALLRHQLTILQRQVKRPACTNTDRMFLVLLARLARTWKQALIIVQPETRLALASRALPPALETEVQGRCSQAEGRGRNDRASSGRWRRTIDSGVPSAFAGKC